MRLSCLTALREKLLLFPTRWKLVLIKAGQAIWELVCKVVKPIQNIPLTGFIYDHQSMMEKEEALSDTMMTKGNNGLQ